MILSGNSLKYQDKNYKINLIRDRKKRDYRIRIILIQIKFFWNTGPWSPRVNQNSLSNSVSKWPPWSNQCPETSTGQKTIKKPCGFCQGLQPAKRMDTGKVAEGGFLRLIFCWITSQSPQILQETYWSPHGSEIHPENSQVWLRKNHGLGLHPVWGFARDLQGGR